jgi:predicted XRE-type DNA-binding protein
MANAQTKGDSARTPLDAEKSAKQILAAKLNALISARDLSQAEVAGILKMPQPKISAIRNHKLRGISLERLMQALTALGQHVEIVITPSPQPSHARIDVAA